MERIKHFCDKEHFYQGRVFYDEEFFFEFVKNYPILPLTEKDFNHIFAKLSLNLWLKLESCNSIPNGKDWNEWLDRFYQETLRKFMKKKEAELDGMDKK